MRVLWILLTLSLLGCGEIAYKRGAGSEELARAKQNCDKQAKADAYVQCMQAQGWQIHKLDEESPLAIVVEDTDNRGAGDVYVPASSTASVKAGAVPGKASPPDPMKKFKVSSWWKPGAGQEELKADTAACVSQLGSAHAPDIAAGLATRGLVICLKERGWYGLQAY